MSISIAMYKVQPLNKDELRRIRHMNVLDLDELDGWEIKALSFKEISENSDRFEYIKDYLRTVELLYTHTDFKACCVAHGMPEDTKSYSYQYVNGDYHVRFSDLSMWITKGDLTPFTTTNKKTYCVIKRKHIDANVSNWVARQLMTAIEEVKSVGEREIVDLSYTPIKLNAKNCETICNALVEMYDNEEFYPDCDSAQFMIELMRTMCKHENDIFIEFQD